MNLDLDAALADLLEWDFSVTVGGVRHVTQPLTIGDVARIHKATQSGDGAALVNALSSLFSEPKPSLEEWRIEQLMATTQAITEYWKTVTAKNSLGLSARVTAGMAPIRGTSTK